jgi:hypothetical protein
MRDGGLLMQKGESEGATDRERCRDADDVKAQLPWKNKCAVWPEGELAVQIAVSGKLRLKYGRLD